MSDELRDFIRAIVVETIKRGYFDLKKTEEESDAILQQVLDEKFKELKGK